MSTALISLGSNLGDRADALRKSLELLALTPGVRLAATSTFHETKPAGGPASQEKFLNAAALLETELPPREILLVLQDVEQKLGRIRAERWGPRTIDLDLLLYDDLELDTPELTLPHPRMSFRRFVLEPAAEIAAEMVHPVCGNTIGGLLKHLDNSPRCVAIGDFACIDLGPLFGDVAPVRVVTADPYPEQQGRAADGSVLLEAWLDRNSKRLEDAIASLAPGQWTITDWWETYVRWQLEEVQGTSAPGCDLQPRLFVVAPQRCFENEQELCDDARKFIHERYRGPVLWLKQAAPIQLRDEVMAAMAAME